MAKQNDHGAKIAFNYNLYVHIRVEELITYSIIIWASGVITRYLRKENELFFYLEWEIILKMK